MESFTIASYQLPDPAPGANPIRIMLVDDHQLVIIGLRTILGAVSQFQVVGEAGSAAAAVTEARLCHPDVVLMDFELPDGSGVEACQRIRTEDPSVRVLMLSAHEDQNAVVGAITAGAVGYILKQNGPDQVVAAVRVVAAGGSLLDPTATHVALEWMREHAQREQSILQDAPDEDPGAHLQPRVARQPTREPLHPASLRQVARHRRESTQDALLAAPHANLRPPVVPLDLVPRPALFEHLERGLLGPLTVLSAPAGFGKTTLIAAWAAQSLYPVAWLSLERDESLKEFLRTFVAAVDQASPGLCVGTLGLLQFPKPPSPSYLASKLDDELAEVPERLTIVLDDFQVVTNAEIHALLAHLVQRLPLGVRMVIATRNEIPPPFTPLRARGAITEIGRTSLRFSLEETKTFLSATLDAITDEELVESLAERTEGWPAGLRLARLALGEEPDPVSWVNAFTRGSHPYVRDFLVAQVLSAQPHEMQDILLQISVLDQFCAQELDAFLGEPETGPHGDEILHMLARSNLFVVQLDPDEKWFRFHHLFQEALREKLLGERGPAYVAALHDRAVVWLENQGLVDEAIRHALAAGKVVKAAILVEEHTHAALDDGDWMTIEAWLDLLPPGLRDERPALLLAHAWTLHFRHRDAEIDPILNVVEHLMARPEFEVGQTDGVRAEADALWAMVRGYAGAQEEALARAQRALERLPSHWSFARGFAAAVSSAALQRLGRADEAVAWLTTAINESDGESDAWRSHMLASLARLHWAALDLTGVEDAASRLVEVGHRRLLANPEALGHLYLGLNGYEHNELERAAEQFESAMALRHGATFGVWTHAALGRALVFQARDEVDAAKAQMQELEDFVWRTENPQQLALVHSFQVRLALLCGDVDAASRLLHGTRTDASLTTSIETAPFTRAVWLVALGTEEALREAGQIAASLERQGEAWQHRRIRLQAALVRSLVLDAQGHTDEGLRALEFAMALAEPGDLVRTFVDLGEPMHRLLTRLSARGHATSRDTYLARLIKSFGGSASQPSVPQLARGKVVDLTETLSWRELEVLELLGEHLSNKEIAERLYLSPLTVKRHTISVYRKLEVTGRRQAVTRALSLQLLPIQRASESAS